MKKVLLPAATALSLTACVPATPIVSDYNGSSVKIQMSQLADAEQAKANAQNEANRICGKVGKRAEYASTRVLPDYNSELLYLCL